MDAWRRRLDACKWVDSPSKNLFLRFAGDAVAHQIGPVRIEKYRGDISVAYGVTKQSLIAMLEDVNGTVSAINSCKTLMPTTKKDCKRTLGSIYGFWKTGDRSFQYLDRKTKEIFKHRIGPGDIRLPKDVILREEIRELASHANSLDKAIIYLLFESGQRGGEFKKMKKGDVTLTKEGMLVRVPAGKTGERRVIVVEATSFVARWLDEHPLKSPDAPLWISPHTWKPLGIAGIRKRIRLCVERMNADRKAKGAPPFIKSINLHNFRHSRATELGAQPGMTEAIMCKFFGWILGSRMPRVYLHLTEEQVTNAVLRTYGKAKLEDVKVVTHRSCPRCKEENPIALNYCGRCGSDMNSGKVVSSIEQMKVQMEDMKRDLTRMQEAMVRNFEQNFRNDVDGIRKKKWATGKHPLRNCFIWVESILAHGLCIPDPRS